MRRRFLPVLAVAATMLAQAPPASAAGTWTWPVTGPVVRAFDPPQDPYGSGHRGIDIAAPSGTPVRAAGSGTVTFAGSVGGELFVTVAHAGGLASTYSWVSALSVRRDDVVVQGQEIARSGTGHPGTSEPPHLHLGVKLDGEYVDPLLYLRPMSVSGMIHLAPILSGP
jgi:murein DD-endopeptidase MepM/ murein hydrolase activator NlpD